MVSENLARQPVKRVVVVVIELVVYVVCSVVVLNCGVRQRAVEVVVGICLRGVITVRLGIYGVCPAVCVVGEVFGVDKIAPAVFLLRVLRKMDSVFLDLLSIAVRCTR